MKQRIAKIILGTEAVLVLALVVTFAVKLWPVSAFVAVIFAFWYGLFWSLNQL